MKVKISETEIYAEAERLFGKIQQKPKGAKDLKELCEITGKKETQTRAKLRNLVESGEIQCFNIKEGGIYKKYYLPKGKTKW